MGKKLAFQNANEAPATTPEQNEVIAEFRDLLVKAVEVLTSHTLGRATSITIIKLEEAHQWGTEAVLRGD